MNIREAMIEARRLLKERWDKATETERGGPDSRLNEQICRINREDFPVQSVYCFPYSDDSDCEEELDLKPTRDDLLATDWIVVIIRDGHLDQVPPEKEIA